MLNFETPTYSTILYFVANKTIEKVWYYWNSTHKAIYYWSDINSLILFYLEEQRPSTEKAGHMSNNSDHKTFTEVATSVNFSIDLCCLNMANGKF